MISIVLELAALVIAAWVLLALANIFPLIPLTILVLFIFPGRWGRKIEKAFCRIFIRRSG